MARRELTSKEREALRHFELSSALLPDHDGRTTIDGENFDLDEEEEPEKEERPHCHVCGGSGQGHFGGTCPECRGWGVLPTEAELEEAAEAEIEAREWDRLV